MNIARLSGRKQVHWLRKKGKVFKTSTMMCIYVLGVPLGKNEEDAAWYIGTAASTKLHKHAVKRNRMRRRCREAIRTAVKDQENLPSLQLLIAPRSASLDAPYAQLQSDVERFLQHLNAYGSKTED